MIPNSNEKWYQNGNIETDLKWKDQKSNLFSCKNYHGHQIKKIRTDKLSMPIISNMIFRNKKKTQKKAIQFG